MFFKKKKKEERELIDWKPLSQRIAEEPDGLSIGSAIYIGKRSSQQDSIIASNVDGNKPVIAILSDGMGGMADGSKASTTCTEGIFNDFNMSRGIKDYPNFLREEINKYDSIISDFKDEYGNPVRSGATLIACIVDNGNLYWGTVGDSHLYIIRGDEIIQVNRDHNFMYDLMKKVERGTMTEAQAQADPHKDSLISFMGMHGVRMMDINEKPFVLQKGDIVLMCSDGLYRALHDLMIKEIVNIYKGNVENACKQLITAVMEVNNPAQDNTSVIIIKN